MKKDTEIIDNIKLRDLHLCWLKTVPFEHLNNKFSVIKTGGAIREYRLVRKGKESVVLQYPETKTGFCVVTNLI